MSSDTKHQRAVAAAAEQFLRYGLARTTMNDIARGAGMSRPALYLLFPEGKMQLFEAAVLYLSAERANAIRDAIAGVSGLGAQLFAVCEEWCMKLLEMRRTVPDSVDMDNLELPVVRKAYSEVCAIAAKLLGDHGVAAPLAADLATNLVYGVRGFTAIAKDDEEMRRMTRIQVDTLVKAVTPPVA